MNIRNLSIVATLISLLISTTSAQDQPIDLPDPSEVARQSRNEAYKQRLLESKINRRKNLRNAGNSAAQLRSRARRERLASRTEPKAPAALDPLQPGYSKSLNGEHIETLDKTYTRGVYGSGTGSGYVAIPIQNGVFGFQLNR